MLDHTHFILLSSDGAGPYASSYSDFSLIYTTGVLIYAVFYYVATILSTRSFGMFCIVCIYKHIRFNKFLLNTRINTCSKLLVLYLSNFITLLPSPIHEIMSIQYSFNLFWWRQRESLDILSQRILDKTLIISNVGVGKVFDIDGYFVCAVIQMYVGRYVIRISLKIKQNIILARGPWPTSLI